MDYEKTGDLDKAYSEVDIEDDETIAEENFPSRALPPEAMRRWGRTKNWQKPTATCRWAYALFAKLFTHLTGIDFDAPEDGDVAVQASAEGTMIQDQPWKARATEDGAVQDDHQPAAEAGGDAGSSDGLEADEQTTADE